jgi:hypothetical protein
MQLSEGFYRPTDIGPDILAERAKTTLHEAPCPLAICLRYSFSATTQCKNGSRRFNIAVSLGCQLQTWVLLEADDFVTVFHGEAPVRSRNK